ncbi:hypothetical protein Droror1_Dr00013998 [Drosera rotundifolia]
MGEVHHKRIGGEFVVEIGIRWWCLGARAPRSFPGPHKEEMGREVWAGLLMEKKKGMDRGPVEVFWASLPPPHPLSSAAIRVAPGWKTTGLGFGWRKTGLGVVIRTTMLDFDDDCG